VLAGQGAVVGEAAVPPWLVVDDARAAPMGAARLPAIVGVATVIVVALLLRSARL